MDQQTLPVRLWLFSPENCQLKDSSTYYILESFVGGWGFILIYSHVWNIFTRLPIGGESPSCKAFVWRRGKWLWGAAPSIMLQSVSCDTPFYQRAEEVRNPSPTRTQMHSSQTRSFTYQMTYGSSNSTTEENRGAEGVNVRMAKTAERKENKNGEREREKGMMIEKTGNGRVVQREQCSESTEELKERQDRKDDNERKAKTQPEVIYYTSDTPINPPPSFLAPLRSDCCFFIMLFCVFGCQDLFPFCCFVP